MSRSSFLFGFAGAALITLGSMFSWVSVQLAGDTDHLLTQRWLGIDVPEGLIVMVLGALSIVGILLMGSRKTNSSQSWINRALAVAAITSLAITIVDSAGALDRYRSQGLDRSAAAIARASGVPIERVLEQLRSTNAELASVHLGSGLWISMAGAVILGAAVLVSFRAAVSAEPTEAAVESAELGTAER